MLPSILGLYITYHCQLKCKHCFLNHKGLLNQYEMPLEDIMTILDDAKNHQVFLMPLSGGDPLLHKDIFTIVKEAKKRKILPLLGITGIDVDDNLAGKIKKEGVSCVQVSLDGPNEKINAIYRGKGVFEKVITSIKNLRSASVKTNLAISLDKYNYDYLGDMLELAYSLDIYKVKLAFWMPTGKEKDRELSLEQKRAALKLSEKFEKRAGLSNWVMGPNPEFFEGEEESVSLPHLVVAANGDFLTSEMGEKIGNIRDGLPSYFYEKYLVEKGFIEGDKVS